MLGISELTHKTYGFSKVATCLSLSVTQCGDVSLHFNCTPSTISEYVSAVSLSSIKTTPSLPTFS